MSHGFSVGVEESIAPYEDWNNGAGPLWCFGSRTIVRDGDTVFAVVPELSQDVPPLCCTRWRLFRRGPNGPWECVNVGAAFDEREPCPLALLPGGRLLLSANPAVQARPPLPDGRIPQVCEPRILVFDAAAPDQPPEVVRPVWDGDYHFTEHTYRALAVDPVTGYWAIFYQVPIEGHYSLAWSYYDAECRPVAQGVLHFPMRGCYQQVVLRNHAVHVFAVSDEIEPVDEWRAYKREVTGKDWDYDFRQLFYTWTPDIRVHAFSSPFTVVSRDETAGHTHNVDLWVDAAGDAHLLFVDRNIWHPYMRDRFFPGIPTTIALKTVRMHDGRVAQRRTLLETEEDMNALRAADAGRNRPALMKGAAPGVAGFHATGDGRLFVLGYQSGGGGPAGLWIRQAAPELSEPVPIPLSEPLPNFFAANARTGTAESDVVDVYGLATGSRDIRYVQGRVS